MYTMKDEGTLRKGFLIAGIVVLPVIFLTGMFGILAVGMDAAENPSVAMISFVKEVMPFWSVVALLVLGIVLVMSSMDTMLNGITSTITVDIARTKPEMGGQLAAALISGHNRGADPSGYLHSLEGVQRALSVPDCGPGVRGGHIPGVLWAVLQTPERHGGADQQHRWTDFVGALFFPNPDFGAWNSIPGAGRLVISFGAALGVSGVLSIAFGVVARTMLPEATFDFSRLREKVGLIEG